MNNQINNSFWRNHLHVKRHLFWRFFFVKSRQLLRRIEKNLESRIARLVYRVDGGNRRMDGRLNRYQSCFENILSV